MLRLTLCAFVSLLLGTLLLTSCASERDTSNLTGPDGEGGPPPTPMRTTPGIDF